MNSNLLTPNSHSNPTPLPMDSKTFKQVAEEYLADARGKVATTTHDRYLDTLERNVYPEYADTPMSEVTRDEMNRYLMVAVERAAGRGRTLTNSGLVMVKAVMSNVINFADAKDKPEKPQVSWEKNSYEELSPKELEMVCLRARHSYSPELLAALLSIYCGMRTGELCALNSDDVDKKKNEINIHETAHRVRNPRFGEPGEHKTTIIIEEIPRKKQIRRVSYPSVLNEYIDKLRLSGRPLIRDKDDTRIDARTLENRLVRDMGDLHSGRINFERLRKTYINGKADEEVLRDIFK